MQEQEPIEKNGGGVVVSDNNEANDSSQVQALTIEPDNNQKKSKQKKFRGDTTKKNSLVQDVVDQIQHMIIGQEEAKKEIGVVLTNTLVNNPYDRTPIGILFFPGPTGVGKTEFARSLFKIFYGDEFINIGKAKIDCNAFTLSHEVSQLKGAPPGYKGYGDKPLLHPDFVFEHTNKALKRNSLHPLFKNIVERDRNALPSIILLDEFEKAHPEFITFFMNIFDEGTATLKDGTEVNFRNTIFIMSSNVGADDIQAKIEGKGTMGFMQDNNSSDQLFSLSYYKSVIKKSGLFKTEVLGRLGIVPFKPLSEKEFHQRLDLQVEIHNKAFSTSTNIRLELSKSVKKHLVDASMKTNEGGRSLIKMFKHDIYTSYTRLCHNGEVERIEEDSGHPVKRIYIDFKDGQYEEYLMIDENKKALNKEKKAAALLERRKKNLDQQETIISLQENSFLVTMRDTLLPNLKYYKALIKHKEKLTDDFAEEISTTKKILVHFGLQPKDFDLLRDEVLERRYQEYDLVFNELSLESSGVLLWNDDEKKNSFSGMLRYVEKYMRNYFDTNKDLKAMIKGGAGKLSDGISPVVEYAEKLLSRDLTHDEEGILTAIFHREYLKLASYLPIDKQIEHKKVKDEDSTNSSKKEKSKKEVENKNEKSITININFGASGNETSWKDQLKNLFGDNFEYVMLAIRQNVSSKKDTDDIIDLMVSIKIELERQFGILGSTDMLAINNVIQELLKEEEILKPKRDWLNSVSFNFFNGTWKGNRTLTSEDKGFWVPRVYQFHHPGIF